MKKSRNTGALKAFSSLFLTVLLCLSSCASRGGLGNTDSDFSLSGIDVVVPDSPQVQKDVLPSDMLSDFKILRENGRENAFLVSEESADLIEYATFERNTALAADYGLQMSEIVTGDIVSRVRNEVLAENCSFDMLILSAASASSLITSGSLADLNAMQGFDTASDGYSQKITEELSFGESTYLVTGDATPSLMLSVSCVLLNTGISGKLEKNGRLYDITGGHDLLTLAANGGFTTDIMLALSHAASDISGNSLSDAEAASSYIKVSSDQALPLFLGSGISFYESNAVTGILTPSAFGSAFGDIYLTLEKLYGIDEENGAFYSQSSSSPLFTVSNIQELIALLREGSPFLPLPMPKYTASDDPYFCTADLRASAFTALPSGKEDNENALLVMNLIYSASADISAAPRTLLLKNVSESLNSESADKAAEVFDIIQSSAGTDKTLFSDFSDLYGFFESCIEERKTRKAFLLQGAERASAAVTALSIMTERLQ